MVFKLIDRNKLLVILSCEDMKSQGITLSQLMLGKKAAPELITNILDIAKTQENFDHPKSKLFIEITPTKDGVSVYITAVYSYSLDDNQIVAVCQPAVFAFDNMEDLIKASLCLFNRYCHRIFNSTVYKIHTNYLLTIYPLDSGEGLTVDFLKEFAPIIGQDEISTAYVEEYGTQIISHNAIDKIAYYLG